MSTNNSLSLTGTVQIIKPKPGDLFVLTRDIEIIDIRNNIISLKEDDIITLIEITNQNPAMRLDRKTRFISNWICKFIYENKMFILKSQNNSQESLLFEYMELVTEEVAERLDRKMKNKL